MSNQDRIIRTVVGDVITFEAIGEDGKPTQSLRLHVGALSAEVKERAMLHGLIQTIGDAAAIGYKQPDGSIKRPTMAQKFEEMADRISTLQDGAWSSTRERTATSGETLLALALVRVSGKDDATVAAYLAGLSKEERRELGKVPNVKHAMLMIQAEKHAGTRPDADAPSLLDGLMGTSGPESARRVSRKKS